MKTKLPIDFTRAYARSGKTLAVVATRDNAEPFDPDGRFYRYDRDDLPPQDWTYSDFGFHIQSMTVYHSAEHPTPDGYFVLLSSEGDVYHTYWKENFQEKIQGAGSWSADSRGYGRLTRIREIGQHLYACGEGGQIYVRKGNNDWRLLTDKLLLNPNAQEEAKPEKEPEFLSPEWQEWVTRSALNPASRDILFFDINGLSEEAIYLCGEEGPGTKPVLCFWDGHELHELKIPIPVAALTGIYIENPDSVWICGREGVLIHGSHTRGFSPVALRQQHNLFHMITPYREKLVMAASVRPGGLYEYDPKTGTFGRFDPPLPRLSNRDDNESIDNGPFFAQAIENVLWVVTSKDVFRFDGAAWERIEHPDL